MDAKYELKKSLVELEHNERVDADIKELEKAKRWLLADDGEAIGHDNYYIRLSGFTLTSAFMGIGTHKDKTFDTPSGEISEIFGSPKLCGSILMSVELVDALINVLKLTKLTPNNSK